MAVLGPRNIEAVVGSDYNVILVGGVVFDFEALYKSFNLIHIQFEVRQAAFPTDERLLLPGYAHQVQQCVVYA